MNVISELNYTTFDAGVGWIGVLSSSRGLLRATLPQHSAEEAQQLLGIKYAISSPYLFDDLVQRFRSYLSGRRVTFPDKLDFSGATAFQRQVWEATRLVAYGNTRSYSWVAEQIEKPKAARAVGQALARNPLPIIVPCHRVVNTDGRLGGFGGGLEMKRRLLHLEAQAQ